jgi:hypothetical protein
VVPTGWSLGGGSGDHRVCRYVADADGSGAIDANIEHPADYVDVAGSLLAQNFLVVRGDQACPAASDDELLASGHRHGAAPTLTSTLTVLLNEPLPAADPGRFADAMREALALAEQAVGLSEPNPRVGCVIVGREGRILGRGHTQEAGGRTPR